MKKLLLFVLVCCAPVGYMACGRPQTNTPTPPANALQQVSVGLLNLARAVGDTQTTVIQLHDQKTISDDTFARALNACIKVSMAGKQADALTAKLVVLSPADQRNVAAVITPVAQTVYDVLNSDLAGIQDQKAQATIRASFSALQSVIASIQFAVGR